MNDFKNGRYVISTDKSEIELFTLKRQDAINLANAYAKSHPGEEVHLLRTTEIYKYKLSVDSLFE